MLTQPAAVVASKTHGGILCFGQTTTVPISATGGTGAYTGTGDFQQGAGSHTYTVTDANGCTSDTTVELTQPAAISAMETTSPATCNGAIDGSVTVTVSGGTAPYSVTVHGVTQSVAASGGTTTFMGLASGTYPASITDAHTCPGSATGVLVAQPPAISASETTSPASCNGVSNGSVTVTVSGGT